MAAWKSIIIYGLAMAVLVGILKFAEYRYFVRDMSLELYIGLIAVLFIGLGAWIGRRLTKDPAPAENPAGVIIAAETPQFELNEANLKQLGITKREREVLELIAAGMSNQEIADKLFVSTSTIKTHTSSLFSKLDANRRTQAIQRARELGILA